MANPWLKKNPFMSAWLSAANRVAGTARGKATAQAKRQASTAVTQAAHENVKLWTEAMTFGAAKPKRKR